MKLCGQLLNRGRVFQLAVSLPLVVLAIIFAEPLASLFSKDPEVIAYAVQYQLHQSFNCLLLGQRGITQLWLQRIKQPYIPMRSNIFWLIIHFPIVYIMVFYLQLGIPGLCYSITVSCCISYVILQIDIYRCEEIKSAIFWPDRSSF